MAEYVERDVLCALIEKHYYNVSGDLPDESIVKQVYKMAHSHIQDVVQALPAADVRPVVRGKWISRLEAEEIFENGGYNVFPYGECLICGHCDWDCTESENFNFCPNCGADMRSEGESLLNTESEGSVKCG